MNREPEDMAFAALITGVVIGSTGALLWVAAIAWLIR
jgi:hypothetical protein